MRYKVLIGLVVYCVLNVNSSGAVGISSKLDFGNSQSPKLIDSSRQKTAPIFYKSVKIEKPKASDDFENIGVVCTGEGCNETKTIEPDKDAIETDVVVHVKTKVVKENKTLPVDDTPDVPVIVGTDNNSFNQGTTLHTRPLIVSTDEKFMPTTSSFDSFPSYSVSSLFSDSLNNERSDFPSTEPRVDINIKTLSPVNFNKNEDGSSLTNIKYKGNGIELQVPHFEPAYHSHYFGENPPPQFVWYPRHAEITPKPAFIPVGSISNSQRNYKRPKITCSYKHESDTGLQWYPRRRIYGNDPGSQINDKLAPLN